MGMGFAPTWLRQVSPPLHKTTLTTDCSVYTKSLQMSEDTIILFIIWWRTNCNWILLTCKLDQFLNIKFYKVVYRLVQGVMGSTHFVIVCWVRGWKKYKNWSTFAEVMYRVVFYETR